MNGTTNQMPVEKTRKEILLELKAKRQEAKQAEDETLELEALELEQKYTDAGQKEGLDFIVVTTGVGNFVVRKPEFIVGKQFADSEDRGVETVIKFVDPCILFPDRMQARVTFQEHAGVAFALANALMRMYEADAGKKRGK